MVCSSSLKKSDNVPYLRNKLRALLVDDSRVCRLILRASLESFNVECMEAEDGREAVEIFMEGKRFDIVFMDMFLPNMDGVEATRAIRDMGIRAMIVGVVDEPGAQIKRGISDSSIDKFVAKPLTIEKLHRLLLEVDRQL